MNAPRTSATVALFCLLSTTTPLSLAASTVYRCGNAYMDVPCPQAAVVDVDDARSAAQQADARQVAVREASLASRMAADRERAEVRPTHQARTAKVKSPAAAASTPVRAGQRSRTRFHQDNGQGDFVAFVPRPTKK